MGESDVEGKAAMQPCGLIRPQGKVSAGPDSKQGCLSCSRLHQCLCGMGTFRTGDGELASVRMHPASLLVRAVLGCMLLHLAALWPVMHRVLGCSPSCCRQQAYRAFGLVLAGRPGLGRLCCMRLGWSCMDPGGISAGWLSLSDCPGPGHPAQPQPVLCMSHRNRMRARPWCWGIFTICTNG